VTLVELMIVILIFGVGILALAAVQTRSNSVVYATGQDTRALSIGQAQVEVARAAGFAGAQPDSGQVDGFDWRTEILPVSAGLNQVRVTVAWAEGGRSRSLQFNTLLSAR
jgi:Tfp pilus assembly protein PilV